MNFQQNETFLDDFYVKNVKEIPTYNAFNQKFNGFEVSYIRSLK